LATNLRSQRWAVGKVPETQHLSIPAAKLVLLRPKFGLLVDHLIGAGIKVRLKATGDKGMRDAVN